MVDAACEDDATDVVSLFDALRQQYGERLPVSTFSLPTLTRFVHTLQEVILQRRIPAALFAGFQHMLAWQDELNRYSALAAVARRVFIFAHNLSPDTRPLPVSYVRLAADDPLRREVFLLGVSAQFSFLICGQERLVYAGQQAALTFETVFSLDPLIVRRGLGLIQTRGLPEAPVEDSEGARDPRMTIGSDLAVVSELLSLLAKDEENLRQQLRQIEREIEQERLLNQALMESVPVLHDDPHQALQLAVEHERARLLANFLRSASFDFRTPLSVLNTSIHLLERIDDPERRQEQIAVLRQQADYLTKLTEALFDIIQLESRDDVTMRPVLLDDVARTMAITLRQMAEAKHLNVYTDLEKRAGMVYADEGKLYLALRQIADNAVRYTPSGGSITLATVARYPYALIEIRDTGAGISPDDLPRIFDHFYRGGSAAAESSLGLGLTIARIVIEKHGGLIEVDSVPGRGSAFRVLLPRLDS